MLAVCCAGFPKEYCWFDSPQSPFQCLENAVAFGLVPTRPRHCYGLSRCISPFQRQLNCWGTLLLYSGAPVERGLNAEDPFQSSSEKAVETSSAYQFIIRDIGGAAVERGS